MATDDSQNSLQKIPDSVYRSLARVLYPIIRDSYIQINSESSEDEEQVHDEDNDA